jgi:phage gp16-like protein
MTVQPGRRARLAKIHIAKKQLAMVDESYRAMLVRITGQESAATCTEAQLDKVIEEFARLGFAEKPRAPRSDKAYVRMIYGIWADLKPFVREHSGAALRAFVYRQTAQDAPEFLDAEDANLVIEGLKAWLGREQGKARAARAGKATTRMRRKPAGVAPTGAPKGPARQP